MASLLSIGSGAMPGPRLPVRKIRDVLRLSAAGMNNQGATCVRREAGPSCFPLARAASPVPPTPPATLRRSLSVRTQRTSGA